MKHLLCYSGNKQGKRTARSRYSLKQSVEASSSPRPRSIFRAQARWDKQGRRDSNPRPTVLETAALPTELRPWVAPDCSPAETGTSPAMTDLPQEDPDRPTQEDREHERDGDLLAEQEGKGYGEDEGERESALPE